MLRLGIFLLVFCFFSQLSFAQENPPSENTASQQDTNAPLPSESPTTKPTKTPLLSVKKALPKKEVKMPPQTSKKTEKSQEDSSTPPVPTPSSENNQALDSYFKNNATQESPVSLTTSELPSAWGPFFFLLVLVFLVYVIIRWVKNRIQILKTAENPVDFIRTVATIPLTGNAQMVLVDVGGNYSLLSVTPHSCSLLWEIKDPDLILKIQSIPLTGNSQRFADVFLKLVGIRTTKKITSLESEKQLKKFIETQKDRIGKM